MALFTGWGFDFVHIGTFSLVVTDPGGTSTITGDSNGITRSNGAAADVVESAVTTWCPVSLAAAISAYAAFPTILGTALTNDTQLSGTFTVTLDQATGLYTLKRTGNTSWTIDAGTNALARNVLGLATSGAISSASDGAGNHQIVSARRPYYVILGTRGGRSDLEGPEEPDDISEEAEDDAGEHYGISVDTAAEYWRWVIAAEPEAATRKSKATASVPWTWQHAIQHARNIYPFGLIDSSESIACYLLKESAPFRGERLWPNFEATWNIPMSVRVKGTL